MLIKVDSWPVVRPDDNGIRPAGRPDVCFYCQSKVGEPHGQKCVTISVKAQYDVVYKGQKVGVFNITEPVHWDDNHALFHKNGASWCMDNAAPDITWSNETLKEVFLNPTNGCNCSEGWSFQNRVVIDAGPFIEVTNGT